MRRLRLEALEDRRLLSLVGVPPLGGLDWITPATDEPAEAGTPPEIAYSGEAGILTAAPSTPDLLAESDTGISSTDNLTNLDNSAPEKALRFSVANTIAGATVTLYADGTAIGSAVADSATTTVTTNGSFDLADRAHAITARQTAPGEEESSNSAALEVTIDTLAPAMPLAPDLQSPSDTGTSSADNITGDNTPTFNCSVPAGIYFRVYRNSIQISGDWEIAVTYTHYTTTVQPDGTYGYTVAAVDVAGNASAPSPSLSVTIDTTIPSAPDLLAVSDTGISGIDDVTNLDNSTLEKSLQFAIGNTIAGATVTLYADGTAIGSAVADSATTMVVTSGSFDLTDRTHAVTARQTLPGQPESRTSAALNVTIRATAPATPRAPDLQAASDTGISSTDNITADNTLTLSVPVSPAPFFRVYRDGVQISRDYEIGAAYTTPPQLDGTFAYTVAAVDLAGNTSTPSAALPVTIDTTIPLAPDLVAVSDTGVSSTDNVTNLDNSQPDKTLQFTVGNTIAGATVSINADGIAIGSAVADGATTIVTTSGSLVMADGAHTITARQTVPGRLESTDSAILTVTIDTVAPLFLNPRRLGGFDNDRAAFAVTLSGTLAYVTADGLLILDVTNPAAPVRLGSYGAGYYHDVVVSGTLAYVADAYYGLVILDVRYPAMPRRLGAYYADGEDALRVALCGTVLYMTEGNAGLHIFDVSNPAKPVRLGGCDTGGYAVGVVVSGTLAYVADEDRGLLIFDVSNPAKPVQLGGCATGGRAFSVTVSGTLAYVADLDLGLLIFDLSDPAAPVRVGAYDTSGYAHSVTLSESLAYVADESGGLVILDVGNPTAPGWVGECDTGGFTYDVAVSGARAYVTDRTAGFTIIDVSALTVPQSLDLRTGSDTGANNADNITNDSTPSFGLSIPAAWYFRVYRDGVQISGDYASAITFTAPVQADGTSDYTVVAVDAAGNVSPQSPSLRVTIDTTAPTVATSVVNGGAAQRSRISSLALRFSEDVAASLGATDLTLVNRDSGATVKLSGVTPGYDAATQTATWNLSDIALEDGYYRATLTAAGILDVAGNHLAGGNYRIEFFSLLGDTDGNARVDIFDVAKLQVNYGQTSGMSPAEGDFDGNGTVDIFDVAILQTQYGKILTAPAPMPAGAPEATVAVSTPEHLTRSVRSTGTLPLVAARPGHSPAQSSEIVESLGGRVSGPPQHLTRSVRSTEGEHVMRSVKSTGRRSVETVKPRGSRVSLLPRTLAVHHDVENVAWESAVDEVLEKA